MVVTAFLIGLLLGAALSPFVMALCVALLSLPFAALGWLSAQWRRAWR